MIPLGIFITILLVLAVLFSPRHWAALAVMACVCYLTEGQEVIVLGFHFTAIRIVLLAGFARTLVRGEWQGIGLTFIDKSLLAYVAILGFMYTLRLGTLDALVYQLGNAYNVLLSYWLFRCLYRNYEEVVRFFSALALLIIPLALSMTYEKVSGNNVFGAFGGVNSIAEVREDGAYRAEGSFRIGITAGSFGATLVPLFLNGYLLRRYRTRAILGFLAATVITLDSHSSGPLLAYVSGIFALLMWSQRKRMRLFRWGFVIGLAGLALVMKAPVWFIIARVGDLAGGHAWHRSELIDQAVNHLGSWWLMGSSDTKKWFAYHLQIYGGADVTNQYLVAGLAGGLLAMGSFIWIIVRCFRFIGLAMKKLREENSDVEKLFWGLGSALFAHVVNFFAISYFDQMWVPWYLLLAVISLTTAEVQANKQPDAESERQGAFSPDPPVRVPISG